MKTIKAWAVVDEKGKLYVDCVGDYKINTTRFGAEAEEVSIHHKTIRVEIREIDDTN